MKIETYEIEPQATEIAQLANDSEHRELCEKLSLTGQLSLSDNESETVFPYRRMTHIEQRVFEIHCPIKTKIHEYKSDAIPVRVLQVAAHAMECDIIKKVYVWHPKEAKLDPVLVGYTSDYGGDLYLLARWGQVWKDFTVLLKEAKQIWATKRKANVEKALIKAQESLKTLSQDSELFFSDDEAGHIDNYISF